MFITRREKGENRANVYSDIATIYQVIDLDMIVRMMGGCIWMKEIANDEFDS